MQLIIFTLRRQRGFTKHKRIIRKLCWICVESLWFIMFSYSLTLKVGWISSLFAATHLGSSRSLPGPYDGRVRWRNNRLSAGCISLSPGGRSTLQRTAEEEKGRNNVELSMYNLKVTQLFIYTFICFRCFGFCFPHWVCNIFTQHLYTKYICNTHT